jgi:hypothetical protein
MGISDNYSYQSYSGADIIVVATLGGRNYMLNNLQTISISSYKDVSPVRAIGHDGPLAYAGGTRTISGSLVFTRTLKSEFDEMIKGNSQFAIGDLHGYQSGDRMPRFDITMYRATEYGDYVVDEKLKKDESIARLIGVSLMMNGTVMSIHDVYSESTFNYVALEYQDFFAENTANKRATTKNYLSEYYQTYILKK